MNVPRCFEMLVLLYAAPTSYFSTRQKTSCVDWVCTGASQAPHCAAAGTQHLQRPLMSTLNFLLATVFVTPFCSPQRQNHFKSHTAPEAHASQSSTLWDHRIWAFHSHLVTQTGVLQVRAAYTVILPILLENWRIIENY